MVIKIIKVDDKYKTLKAKDKGNITYRETNITYQMSSTKENQ